MFAQLLIYIVLFLHIARLHIFTLHNLHIFTFTFHNLVPWHIVQTTIRKTHHISYTHRCHLGNTVTTLGLRRPGEQVSTLTSGTCPPPRFHPNTLRILTYRTFPWGLFHGTVPWPSMEAVSHMAHTFTHYTFRFLTHILHMSLHSLTYTHGSTFLIMILLLTEFKHSVAHINQVDKHIIKSYSW